MPSTKPNSGVFSFRIIARVLGGVLLAASVLKAHALGTSPPIERGLLTNTWMLFAVAEFELFLGLWLWSGLYPIGAWWTAIGCFLCFCGTALTHALAGEHSCPACLGAIQVAPWLMVAVDVAAVLWLALAELPKAGEPTVSSHPRHFGVAAALFVVIGLGGLLAFLFCRPTTLLTPSTSVLEFGTLRQGSYHELEFTLTNHGTTSVHVADIESTCGCLRLQLERSTLQPGETIKVKAQLDLAYEPEFLGKIGVDVAGHTETQQLGFRLVATARVR